jgi:4-amino-4-deoxy-L-arabinose transferase-like glycosyltransferase
MRIVVLLIILGCLFTMPVYDKYWAPFDEGIIAVAAERLLAGEVPYKDFFMVMYPPGQIYVLGLLFKVFPAPLTAGRIYTVLLSVGIATLAFLMTRELTGKRGLSLASWFIVLVSLAPRLGAIPAPIWPGIFFSLLTLCLFMKSVQGDRRGLMAGAGLSAGIAVLFRHDLGFFAACAVLTSLVVRAFFERERRGDIARFIAGGMAVVIPCAVYFMHQSAWKDLIASLFVFPLEHRTMTGAPFPAPCLDPNMIFHGSCHFIKINQYYIPPLVYAAVLVMIAKGIVSKRRYSKELLLPVAILLYGVLSFNQVRFRTDPAHLLSVLQPAVILGFYFIDRTYALRSRRGMKKFVPYAASILMVLLFSLLSIKNADKYIKNCFRKVYRNDIIKAQFGTDSIYIPREEREDVLSTVEYITRMTRTGEKIYIGNRVHWKDDFGGSVLLYALADRIPSTKYYELLPGLVTDPRVQEEIRDSLNSGVKLIVLQDIDTGAHDPRSIPEEQLILDGYIEREFKLAKKFGKYGIYLRR